MANPYGPYTTDSTLGANVELTYPAEATLPYRAPPPFALGQVALGTDDTAWVFVTADVAVAANVTVATVNTSTWHITAATGGTGYTTPVAFAAGDSGWIKKTAVAF
jgi:hypothetical protein